MPNYSSEARRIWPYLLPLVERAVQATTIVQNGSGGTPGSGGGAPSPHDLFSSHHTGTLDDAQGPQFLLLDGTRALEGNLAVDPGVTIDGVDLSVHVADPDAHHVRVAAGDGTLVNVPLQEVAVDEAFDFIWTGTHQFNVRPEINANLLFEGGSRTVEATDSLTLSPDDDLLLDPGGLIVLPTGQEMRSGTFNDFVAGIAGFRHWDRGGNFRQLTIGAIKADELYVRVFTADEARVNRGEEFWTRSFGIVETSFTVPADEATVDVWFEEAPGLGGFKLFLPDNWVLIRSIDINTGITVQRIWFQVVDADGAGTDDYISREDENEAAGTLPRQQWRLRRKSGGLTGTEIKKGEVAVDFGKPFTVTDPLPGQGVVHLSALAQDGGPFVQIQTFESVSSDIPQFKNRVRMGNLSGTVDYSSDIFGFAAGDDLSVTPSTGFSGMAAEATNGLRMFNTDIEMYESGDIALMIRRDEGLRLHLDDNLHDSVYSSIRWDGTLGTPDAQYAEIASYANLTDGTVLHLDAQSDTGEGWVYIQAEGAGGLSFVSIESDDGVGVQGTSFNGVFGSAGNVTISANDANGVTISNTGVNLRVKTGDGLRATGTLYPTTDDTYDLGTAVLRWRDLYVDTLHADTISGTTISGAEWEHSGSMVIDANSASDTLLTVANQGTGRVDLLVDRNITLGGTVDGVDIASHAANASAHHNPVTVGNTGLSLSTQVLSLALAATSGLQISSGLMLADTIAGAGLTIASKVLAVNAGDGMQIVSDAVAVDSTVVRTSRTLTAGNGLTGGGDLSANRTFTVGAGDGIVVAATTVAVDLAGNSGLLFSSGDLAMGNPSAVSATSTSLVSGSAHTHAVTASSDVSAGVEALLKSTGAGGLGLASLTVAGNVDVTSGGDLTVGANIFFVDTSLESVGINRAPDPQFSLDVSGALRADYLVGKHAIQLKNALFIAHYDGHEPLETNYAGELNGHRGQVGTAKNGVTFSHGKFNKAVVVGIPATNYIINPRFQNNLTDGWTFVEGGGSITRTLEQPYLGLRSVKMVWGGADCYIRDSTSFVVAVGETVALSCFIFRKFGSAPVALELYSTTTSTVRASLAATASGEWEELVLVWTNADAGARQALLQVRVTGGGGDTVYVSGPQKTTSIPTPYIDGMMGGYDTSGNPTGAGHAWDGTAHNSTSTRVGGVLSYPSAGNISSWRGTIMAWVRAPWGDVPLSVSNRYLFSAGTIELVKLASSKQIRFIINSTAVIAYSWNDWDRDWHHFAVTWDVVANESILYIDGVAVASGVANGFTADAMMYIGGFSGTSSQNWDGYIEDFVISGDAETPERILSIYESDAPVFAESSVFSFRATPKGLVWADEEGLWMRDFDGDPVLGVYGGEAASKSWGGLTLAEGDFALGDANRGSYLLWDDSAASLTLGKTGTSNAALTLSGTDISMVYNSVTRLRMDSNGMVIRDAAGVARLVTDSSGGLVIRNSSNSNVFTFNSSAGAEFTLPLTLGTNGGIYQGTGTFGSPTTGLKIWNQSGIGRIAGYDSGILQWGANTDGKLYAGGGNLIMDANGIRLLADNANYANWANFDESFSFNFTDGVGDVFGTLAGSNYAAGNLWQVTLASVVPSGGGTDLAEVLITADSQDVAWGAGSAPPLIRLTGGLGTSEIYLDADSVIIGAAVTKTGAALGAYQGKVQVNIGGANVWIPYYL